MPEAITINRADLEAQLAAIKAERARRDLVEFVKQGWHVLEPTVELEWNWHHDAICKHIQWMFEGLAGHRARTKEPCEQLAQNLVMNVPPGSLKSRLLSVYGPAWAWLNWPGLRIIALSSNPGVAGRDAMAMRAVVTSDWYRDTFKPGWELKPDQDAKGNFANTREGFRTSKGLNASITGQRGDVILLDDPNDVKDVSDIKLEAVWDRWYAARNRVNDARKSIRICIMQRVHDGDWTGRALEQGGWEHLCLPMEHEPGVWAPTVFGTVDPRTQEGEILHPQRYTPAVLADERRSLGSLGYAGQMQQRPTPKGGEIFKLGWWGTFDEQDLPRHKAHVPGTGPLKFDHVIISVDSTFGKSPKAGQTESAGTSRCSMIVVAALGSKRYVLDNVTRKMTYIEHKQELLKLADRHPYYTKILIERKASGDAILNELGSVLRSMVGVEPMGGKESRANAMVPCIEAGDVLLPRSAPWRDEFLAEFAGFPRYRYDDQVDALSQALADLQENPGLARLRALCAV